MLPTATTAVIAPPNAMTSMTMLKANTDFLREANPLLGSLLATLRTDFHPPPRSVRSQMLQSWGIALRRTCAGGGTIWVKQRCLKDL